MKRLCIILLLGFIGCNRPQPVEVTIELSPQKDILCIKGFDTLILNDINRTGKPNWQSLFPVFSMPADTDMKNYQNAQPGVYRLSKGDLFFKPDTPFKKQQTYFMRYYNQAAGRDIWDYLRHNNHKRVAPHADLVFTP